MPNNPPTSDFIYSAIEKVESITGAVEYFLSTLLLTNRRWDFYVNWDKVAELTRKYKIELGILEAVLESSDEEFFKVVKKYPEVVKVFPRLMAVRDDKFSVLVNPLKTQSLEFDFNKLPKTDKEINHFVKYWKDSGLKSALKDVKNLRDYLFGVEVGSDTNARKNRGGTEWESLIEPLIREIAERNGYEVAIRQKFESLLKKLGHEAPPSELARNMDFIVYKDNKFVDIEANFFSGPGTKLEVPGAYTNRTLDKGVTLSLFLFTDGLGWKTAHHRMEEYFEKFPCVVNYQMAKDGVLEKALKKYLD